MQFDGSDKYICKSLHVAVEEISEYDFSYPCHLKIRKRIKIILLSKYVGNYSYVVFQNQINTLHWRHNKRDCISNTQRLDCLLSHLFRCGSKKTSKLRGIGLCEGNPSVTGDFPSQRASNKENFQSNAAIDGKCFWLCGIIATGP